MIGSIINHILDNSSLASVLIGAGVVMVTGSAWFDAMLNSKP